MSFLRKNVLWPAMVVALVAVLVGLAVLQYKWSREVSEAASTRMRASLQASLIGFRLDLYRELSAVCVGLRVSEDSPQSTSAQLTHAYQNVSNSGSPALVRAIYIWENGESQSRLLRLDPLAAQFFPVEWPEQMNAIKQVIRTIPPEAMRPRGRREFRPQTSGPKNSSEPRRREESRPWFLDEADVALLHPVVAESPESRAAGPRAWIVVQLDADALRDHVFPELAQRYFGTAQGLEYRVAVQTAGNSPTVLYASSGKFTEAEIAQSDGVMNLFGPPGPPGPSPRRPFAPPMIDIRGAFGAARDARLGGVRLESLHFAGPGTEWQIVVQHRGGSLEATVARMRWRNLAISFGVLLVLAATMAMVIVATRRAQRLAQLQMDFVAAVSHELRTPLAVISSAAENIADGIVTDKRQLAKYGAAIKNQSKQLIQLVEQVLLFAAARQRHFNFDMRLLQPSAVVDAALDSTAALVESSGITVECHVDPQLPPVIGDLGALSQCLQNLITNAVKYGGDSRWVGIRAVADSSSEEVRISVEDHGCGIKPGELHKVFEPFYRSPEVTAAQVRGTGLGLTLARNIAEAMGGRITVTSTPGEGCCFTLHLRAAPVTTEESALAPLDESR